MKLNLQIHPMPTFDFKIDSKCKIPLKYFQEGLQVGGAVKLITTHGNEYIAHAFPSDPTDVDCCFLDSSISITNVGSKEIDDLHSPERLCEVELLELEKQPIGLVSIDIVLNKGIFKNSRNMKKVIECFGNLVKDLLEPYCLIKDCRIKVDNEIRLFGLSEIVINSASSSKAFYLGEESKVVVDNYSMERDHLIELTELAGMEDLLANLNGVLTSYNIHESLRWEVKPSLNTLIIGPSGSGKTALCYNFLCNNSCNVFLISSHNVMRPYPGETEAALREIFSNAITFTKNLKSKGPTVILVEEIETICPSKSDSQNSANANRICGQFCSLLDELYEHSRKIIVLGTSSNVDKINVAVRRPGRFEKEISISALNLIQREKILHLHLKRLFTRIDSSICRQLAKSIAKLTGGFVAADLMLLINFVVQKVIRSEVTYFSLEHLMKEFMEALKTVKPTSLKGSDVLVYRIDNTFADIGGMDELKNTLEVSILTGLRHPDSFNRFGLQLPKGILLYGPPGCAKTTIAKCLASEAKMTFIATSGAEVYSPYVGNSEKYISKLFDVARKNAPCLLFFDEIDSLIGSRSISSRSDVQIRVLSSLLTEIDGIGLKLHSGVNVSDGGNNILVVAATNRPDMIDDALMRPGRFDKLIHVPPPDQSSREGIFKIFKKKMPFSKDVDIQLLAMRTERYSGADICNICNEAALHALLQNFEIEFICQKDFDAVLDKTKPSLTHKQVQWYYDFEKQYIS